MTPLNYLSRALYSTVNLTLKEEVENKTKSHSFFSMPVTRKLYSATGQSTLCKVLLIASMILPLIAFLELTI